MRGLLKLAALAGLGYVAYRKLMGTQSKSASSSPYWNTGTQPVSQGTGNLSDRLTQVASKAREAATTAVNKARAGAASGQAGDSDLNQGGMNPETRAAVMAGMPAVQQPAPFPESAQSPDATAFQSTQAKQ